MKKNRFVLKRTKVIYIMLILRKVTQFFTDKILIWRVCEGKTLSSIKLFQDAFLRITIMLNFSNQISITFYKAKITSF